MLVVLVAVGRDWKQEVHDHDLTTKGKSQPLGSDVLARSQPPVHWHALGVAA